MRKLNLFLIPFNKQKNKNFRNLSKPIGAIGNKKIEIKRNEFFCIKEMAEYQHGSHYSCSYIVSSYLIRLDPFASLAIKLQSGKFDIPDRLFFNIEKSWESCFNNSNDVRELIPEFFYFPEFLKNV